MKKTRRDKIRFKAWMDDVPLFEDDLNDFKDLRSVWKRIKEKRG